MQGRCLLFLHAFPLCGRMWKAQVSYFQSKGYKVLSPSYPGFCGIPDEGFRNLYSYARYVMREVDRCILVGCSMGGYIALHVLEMYPEKVEAIVLSNTRSTPDTPEARRRRFEIVGKLEDENYRRSFLKDMVLRMFHNEGYWLDEAYAMSLEASKEGLKSALLSMANREDKTYLLRTDIPKLIIGSDKDNFVSLEEIRSMHEEAKNSSIYIFENVGHVPNMESAETFNRILHAWLEDTFHS